MRQSALATLLASHCAIAGANGLPLNEAVRQDTVAETICVSGYAKSVRPPSAYSNAVKLRIFRREGIDPADVGRYELDRIIPLALGRKRIEPTRFAAWMPHTLAAPWL